MCSRVHVAYIFNSLVQREALQTEHSQVDQFTPISGGLRRSENQAQKTLPQMTYTKQGQPMQAGPNDGADEHVNDLVMKEVKVDFKHIEDGLSSKKYDEALQAGLSQDDARFLADFTSTQERRVFRKVDFRVVPMLALLYLISHLDRANIGLYPSEMRQ